MTLARTVFTRTFAILTHGICKQAPVKFTADGAVLVSYNTLKSSPLTLQHSIEKAFGSDPSALGIIVVNDLPPSYNTIRERLLKLAHKFANLPEDRKDIYVDQKSRYSFGWSHGKEIMNGKPDTLKGSYYANPLAKDDDESISTTMKSEYPEYYGKNIWPSPSESGVEVFEEAFKELGSFVFSVGRDLAIACQPFASAHLSDASIPLPDLISPRTTKARLLHYFPPGRDIRSEESKEEPVDSWCGFHLDHSLLTGLCSAMYLLNSPAPGEPQIVGSPTAESGLYIRSRGGKLTKVSIPVDCLAFQTGEALELATEGKLRATPHCVRVGGNNVNISRETFALFMQPDVDQLIGPNETFGQFSKRIFSEHYETHG